MSNKLKLNEKTIESLIKEVLSEMKTVEATEVKLNANDKLGDSAKALVYKNTTKKTEKAGPESADVKMNQKAKDLGSDEKAATAVEVKAGSTKKAKGDTTGLANANFESKTENPSKRAENSVRN